MEKGEVLQALFYNHPSRQWHFEEIVQESKMTRPRLSYWLKQYQKKEIIQRLKPRGKMPYYIGNFESPTYKNSKKVYALQQFNITGFLNHLEQIPNAKTIILFGSFSRSDWHSESDIDIFIYGTAEGFEQGIYERTLEREIQLFPCSTTKDISRYSPGLLKNIVKGYLLKGNIDFLEVTPHE